MHVDSVVADIQFATNFLIRQPLCQMARHLGFAWGQLGQNLSRFLTALMGRLPCHTNADGTLDRIEKLLILEGLLQKIDGTLFHRLNGKFHLPMARHKNDREGTLGSIQTAL